ncbi:MAG TPA: SGNH/GDSL hydrolase family protein [Rhodanobacteraceae bacterium]|nr:SGNH/GDSL hydrolase family protein [Rhodanobacteraceae bacterium]
MLQRDPFAWLACLLLLLIGSAARACPPPSQPWQSDIGKLVADDSAHPPPQHGVLFVGSSSIRMWTTLARDFPGVPTINRGFGGSAIADSTHYAGRIVVPYRPRVIVMYAGDNDIEEGCTPRQVLDEFKAFVARVRRGLPNVAIVYISIKPSLARWSLWPQMHSANDQIARWARTQKRVTFVDIASRMLGAEGKPRPDLFRDDGLHMKPAGYAIWIEALKPVLARYGFSIHRTAAAGG